MSLSTHRPSYRAMASSQDQLYMKGRLTFILGPSENPPSTASGVEHEDYTTTPSVSVSARKPSRYPIPRPLPSQATKHCNAMSGRSGSGSSGFNDDDWKNIADEKERRKVQNRNAQRRHSMSLSQCSTPITYP